MQPAPGYHQPTCRPFHWSHAAGKQFSTKYISFSYRYLKTLQEEISLHPVETVKAMVYCQRLATTVNISSFEMIAVVRAK